MAITNPSNIYIDLPTYPNDQIIGVFTNTLSSPAPTLSGFVTTVNDVRAHGFGDSAYFEGIFTTDGGTTWNTFGSQTPIFGAPGPTFQTVDVSATVDTSNVNVAIDNYYDLAHGAGYAYTVTYKIYLIAKNTMAKPITPIKTSNKLLYASEYNYQKIFMKGSVALIVSAGTTGTSTLITHNLGYVPKIRAYYYDLATSSTTVHRFGQEPQTQITATTLQFYSDQSGLRPGITYVIDYRIYLDT